MLAAPARSAASPFELTVEAELTPPFFLSSPGRTFRSRAPFCASGFVEDHVQHPTWRFTCDDGTGSLDWTLSQDATWRIVDGSGSYAGLRGRASLREEQLCGTNCDFQRPIPWRGTLQGFVDRDAVAPTISISSVKAAKLRRPQGAYSLRLGIAIRDNVTDNPVAYTVRACAYAIFTCTGRLELARRFGTATTEAFSTTLRVSPAGARTVQLQLTGEDPVGNAVSVWRALRLPR